MPRQENPYNQIRREIEKICEKYDVVGHELASNIIELISDWNETYSYDDSHIERPDDVLLTYPGQPCLGDVINVIVHEGRSSIARHMHDESHVEYWIKKYTEHRDEEALSKIDKINKGILHNMTFFKELFNQLEALGSRPKHYPLIPLRRTIETDLVVFTEFLNATNTTVTIDGGYGFEIEMSKMDVTTMIGNLVLNSIEAMRDANSPERKITINIRTLSQPGSDILKYITLHDTGPGFNDRMLEKGRCFKAWYSTKPSKLGLGLMCVGEAANRNLLDFQILKTETGAGFRFMPKEMLL